MSKSASIYRTAVAFAALAAAACGSNGLNPKTDLNAVFNKTISNAPVVTYTVQRSNGAAVSSGSAVNVDTTSTFNGWLTIGTTRNVSTNASGVGTAALPNGTYPVYVNANVGGSGTFLGVGRLIDSISVSGDTARTYKTSLQTWTVTSPVNMKAVRVSIYQVDAGGKALYSTRQNAQDPLILSRSLSFANTTSTTFTSELFKGSYRAVIIATPSASTDAIAPFETAKFEAAGGGAQETQSVTLTGNQNLIALKIQDGATAVPDNQVGSVEAFDRSSFVSLGTTSYTGGIANVRTGSVGDVYVSVSSADGSFMAFKALTAASTATQVTLNRYQVTGHVKPVGGASITPAGTNYGTVTAYVRPSFGQPFDTFFQGASATPVTLSDPTGAYTLKLVEGSYDLKAEGVPSFVTPQTVTLTAATATQDLSVDAGAKISGSVKDQSANNVSGLNVSVFDSAHNIVTGGSTAADGTFSVDVPAGSYDVFVGGALSGSPTVGVSGTASMDLTQFQITGRLQDPLSNPFSGRVRWGGGSVNTSTTAAGTYVLQVVQGLNWFQFSSTSNTSVAAFLYEPLVQVDSNTLKSIPQ